MAESVDWSAFAGDPPPYFEPFDIDYPVAPQSTWATGGTARWPDGSGPGTGKIVVAGSDDVSTYDPDTDILVFGFRDGSGGVTEMGAHNYCVLWEREGNGLVTMHIMPASLWEATTPIASIEHLVIADLPTTIESWAPTNNHFQDDLVASTYALTHLDDLPDNHIAILTHEQGVITTYDYAALEAEHGPLVFNFVTFTGREMHLEYDEAGQSLTISHYGESWGGYNDVWGKTVITNVTPEDLTSTEQLWRYDSANEDGRLQKGRFDDFITELNGGEVQQPDPDDGGHDHGDHGGDGGDGDGGQHHGGDGTSTPGVYELEIMSEWNSGFVAEYTFSPDETVTDWRVTLHLEGDIVNIWNAEILAVDGPMVTLGPAPYNHTVEAGQSITFGFQVDGTNTDVMVVDGDHDMGGEPDTDDPDPGSGDPGTPAFEADIEVLSVNERTTRLALNVTNTGDGDADGWEAVLTDVPLRLTAISGGTVTYTDEGVVFAGDGPLEAGETDTLVVRMRTVDFDMTPHIEAAEDAFVFT